MANNNNFDDMNAIHHIRLFCADMVQKASSGHPGAPLGLAATAHVLFGQVMNYSPKNPNWINRDRFVLSNGHASALLYTMLHLSGYEQFPIEQIKNFRQLHSNTAGHPEAEFDGIEVTTGPLGQGLSNAVGLAIAQTNLAATYNKPNFDLFDNYTYVVCGDGCLMEGISSEASSYAGHLGLSKLIVLYDDNKITIDGSTDLTFTEDVIARYESYGWETLVVENGHDNVEGLREAIEKAKKSDKPTLISVRTIIGIGSSKEGTSKAHGAPLGEDDIVNLKKKLNMDENKKFYVPDEVREYYENVMNEGGKKENQWKEMFEQYKNEYPNESKEIIRRFNNELPENWKESLPTYSVNDAPKATRALSRDVLQALIPNFPELVGGSADLAPSNYTLLGDIWTDYQKDNRAGRNFRFGVREHAMVAICNGMSAYGGMLPFGATFLNFTGYCLGAITLSALSKHRCFFVMTHDSIFLGEDGPTHQPIFYYNLCRGIPNLLFIRPADGNEVVGAYINTIESKDRPTILSLTRHGVPNLEGTNAESVSKGAYKVKTINSDNDEDLDLIIVGTGSELSICYEALSNDKLKDLKIKLVSMPCWELFDEQDLDYKLSIFPSNVPVLSVEAGNSDSWHKYSHGNVGINTFGLSAKAKDLFVEFGFTADNVADKSLALIDFYKDQTFKSKVLQPF